MRNVIIVSAIALSASVLFAQTTSSKSASSQAAKSWPLEEKMVIRFGGLSVDEGGTIACFQGDVFTPSKDASKPPEHSREWVTLDLATGKMKDLSGLMGEDVPKGGRISQALVSPSGKQIAVVVMKPTGTAEIRYQCWMLDLASDKKTSLSEGVGRMRVFWTGEFLLVSRNTSEGVASVERWAKEGKQFDTPAMYAHVLAASSDGKTLLAYCGKDPSKPLKFTDEDVALRILKDRKPLKDLGDAQKIGAERGYFSPSGKFVAFPVRDATIRKQGIRVVEVGGDENRFLESQALPLAVSDDGLVYFMETPKGGSWDRNAKPSAIKKWDGKEESVVVGEALDACMVGSKLYYIEAGDRPVLKVKP